MSTQEQADTATQPSAERPLDRSQHPGLPDAVADLWRGSRYTGGAGPEQDAAVLGGIETIINALADDERGEYRVTLSGHIGTAATDLKGRQVAVTTAALHDPRLGVMERIGITSGMAVHEAGHGRLTRPIARAIERAYPGDGLAQRLSNIGEDIRLERDTAEQWPTFAPLFDLTLWWVAQRYPNGGINGLPASKGQAVNFALAATRYSKHTVWANDADVLTERAWWEQWGERIGAITRPMDHVALIREALDRMADLPDEVEQPGQPEQGEDADEDGDEAMPGMGPQAESDEDPDEDPLSRGGADEAEDEDEAEDAAESGEGEDAAESDEDSDGESLQGDEAGSSGLGDSEDDEDPFDGAPSADDGSEADSAGPEDATQPDAEEGHVPEYHSTDGLDLQPSEGSTDEDADEDEPQGGDTLYGPSGISGIGSETEMQGVEQVERDALNDPLPLHAQDAVTQDDRNRDVRVGRVIEQARVAEREGDVLTIVHDGGNEVQVAIKPLVTKRASIKTTQDAQAVLRSAFSQRRTSHDARNVARSGRLSGSRAYRVRAGFDNVFTRRDAISPDRLDVHLLIDASGSMSGWDSTQHDYSVKLVDSASQLAATLTEALAALPTVRVHVWAHNTYTGTQVWDVYDSRSAEPVGRIGGIKANGGNNDASAIAAVAARIEAERKPRERSVLMVISDGAPCEPQEWLAGAAEAARAKGIGVVSVAISGGLTKTQEACYGPENVVVWEQDWERLARDMAQQIARLA